MPTIEAIREAEETLRMARIPVELVRPGDCVVLHRAQPGEVVCTLSYEATIVSTRNTQPDLIHPVPWWEVVATLDTGKTEVFRCSGKHMLLVGNDPDSVEA